MILPLLLFFFSPTDPQGWLNARWGMTEQQVLAAVPEATPLKSPPRSRTFVREGGNAVANIGVESIRIGVTSWQSFFLMDERKMLSEVRLRPISEADVNETEFNRIEQLLVQKYGRPFERQDREGKERIAGWTIGETVITLSYVDMTPTIVFRSLWLSYTRKPAADLNKL